MPDIINHLKRLDWALVGAIALIFSIGLATFYGNAADRSIFYRQAVFGLVGLALIIGVSFFNWRILRDNAVLLFVSYIAGLAALFVLFVVGSKIRGVTSWFHFGSFSIEPAEMAKVILILVLAKYFSGRYTELHRWKNIIVSGLYAIVPVGLVLIQPDLGSALILGALWFGMVLVSGIKAKQVLLIFLLLAVASLGLWSYVLKPYQKNRVLTFLDPSRDPLGGSYQSTQAIIAIGSAGWLGKGIGQGTQTRLGFLPEYRTDFIFAAIAEEWGLIGIFVLLLGWLTIFYRLYNILNSAADNFSRLVMVGVIIFLAAHFVVNIGANLGFLPITGVPLAFVSYGGSNLLSLCLAVGLVQSIKSRVLKADFDPNRVLWQD